MRILGGLTVRLEVLLLLWLTLVVVSSQGVIRFASASLTAIDCNSEAVTTCIKKLEGLVTEQEFPQDDTLCDELNMAVECVNKFAVKCFSERQKQSYSRFTNGAMQMIKDFCDKKSSFRKAYLEHSACFSTVQDDYKRCADRHLSMLTLKDPGLANNTLVLQEDNFNQRSKKICCMFRDHIRCTRSMIEIRCGTEAADLADDIITKATARLVHPYCAELPIGDEGCSSGTKLIWDLSLQLALLATIPFISRAITI